MALAHDDDTAFDAAVRLFFNDSGLSSAAWRQRLTAGRLPTDEGTDELLSPAVCEKLRDLLHHLEEVDAVGEAETLAGDAWDADSAETLEVRGREGGSYTLHDRIGTGGQSIVYRGVQKAPFERSVAIKVYYAEACGVAAIDNLRELKAISRLQHPGICQQYDAGITPWGQPFLVLELIEGPPLQRFLEQARPGREERLRLFDELLGIVAYVHRQGVIHCDLKPHNILVQAASGRLKLVDFSIAGIDEPDETRRGEPGEGTREYRSPEQAGQTPHQIDARTDIFSLGCLLFELLAGERAFPRSAAGDGPPRAIAAEPEAGHAPLGQRLRAVVRNQSPDWLPRQRAALVAMIERCVATNPAERFQSVADLKAQLECLRTGTPARPEQCR